MGKSVRRWSFTSSHAIFIRVQYTKFLLKQNNWCAGFPYEWELCFFAKFYLNGKNPQIYCRISFLWLHILYKQALEFHGGYVPSIPVNQKIFIQYFIPQRTYKFIMARNMASSWLPWLHLLVRSCVCSSYSTESLATSGA